MVTACKAGAGVLSQGSPKRRKTELLLGGAKDRPVKEALAPKPFTGTLPRGKRTRSHKPVVDAKRRREAAAAFDDMDIDEDGPVPATPAPFTAPVEEPDNPMDVGLYDQTGVTGHKCIVYGK